MKNKVGRPTKISEIDLAKVRSLASMGGTDEQIASALSIGVSTLGRYKHNPQFGEALKKGKDDADILVVSALYKKALAGDTTAMIFWLKNRRSSEWRDRQDITHAGDVKMDNKLVIEVVRTK